MNLPFVSIIMSAGNRPKHLRNTLRAWSRIDYPDYEFILIDNSPHTKEIKELAEEYKELLHLSFFEEYETIAVNRIWNRHGWSCKGEYVIFAMMDEIISCKDIIQKMLAFGTERRVNLPVYFMTDGQTNDVATWDWNREPLRDMPWENIPDAGYWSHITGNYRKNWDYINWFIDERYGHLWLEQDIYLREKFLNINAYTPKDVCCFHQAHVVMPSWTACKPGYIYRTEREARLLDLAQQE